MKLFMFYTRIVVAVLTLIAWTPLFAAHHAPKQKSNPKPSLKAVKNIYILDIDKPTILSITDTVNITHKITIALKKHDINCKSLTASIKNHNFLMKKNSVVYLAKIYKIYTLSPCKKSKGKHS